jgi:hypothetical protein
MCGRKKPRSMIDKRQRGSNDLEVIIYDLKKQIDLLKEEIQAKQIEITNLNDKIKEQIKSSN